MALVPANATLTTWLGTGASTTGSAAAGYFIPAANVATYIPAAGDSVITNDIRDFLFSVLSKCADAYSEPKLSTDTRPQSIVVTKSIDTLSSPNRAYFTVAIEASAVTTTPTRISLPTFD